ncbi:MAG: alpha/beta hydrolase, partial [Verrucomicrobiota bacterium JB023]|nr:alpha/beta hydrolase [Verrucomicrobiota bacterium JB023]
LTLLIIGLVVTQEATDKLTRPTRKPLGEKQLALLTNPEAHGFSITQATGPGETPYLICRPQARTSSKGELLREQFKARSMEADLTAPQGTLLLLHGFRGRKEHHLAIAERFCAVGFTCLIPDLPGHGDHPAQIASFGPREIPLLSQLIRESSQNHGTSPQVGLFGISQGGAIALQLAAAHPELVHSVASLSTFAKLEDLMWDSVQGEGPVLAGLARPLIPAVDLNARLRHGFSPRSISPEEAAAKISCPVFLAHGLQDSLIPPSHAQRISEELATETKTLRLIEKAGHNDVLLKGHEIYADLASFFLQHS